MMNKKGINITIILTIFGIILLSSCYTKKKGIVPCPHGYNDIKIEKIGNIRTEPV